MTISWSVAEVLRHPASHVGDRLVVIGVLYLDEASAFRIFQATSDGYDDRMALEIDDPEAAAAVREALAGAEEASVYLGPAVVDGVGRADDGASGARVVIEKVVTVHLGDPLRNARELRHVEVRLSPWAR